MLDELRVSVKSILGEHFIGMYLYGSLATGGFDHDSDVDYVVVAEDEISEAHFSKIQELHKRIKTMDVWCADQLEGSYIPRQALKTYDPQRALFVHIDRGPDEQLQRMHLDSERLSNAWWGGWVLLRFALREHGITLAGPDPKNLIEPVSPADLKHAALCTLNGWAANILKDPTPITSRGYQSYTVLTLCRILYTLHTGGVTSKPEAIHWAKARLDGKWTPLIERAWIGRQNPGLEAEPDDFNQTLEFIRYTIETSQQLEYTKKEK